MLFIWKLVWLSNIIQKKNIEQIEATTIDINVVGDDKWENPYWKYIHFLVIANVKEGIQFFWVLLRIYKVVHKNSSASNIVLDIFVGDKNKHLKQMKE